MSGELLQIWLKRVRRGPMDAVSEARAVAGRGLVGNANQGGWRQVTILDEGRWQQVREELGDAAEPVLRRANLLVRGVSLAETRGRILRIGPCRLRIRGETVPCRRMEEALPGLQEALRPAWGGGAFAEVLDDGLLTLGDPVSWEMSGDDADD